MKTLAEYIKIPNRYVLDFEGYFLPEEVEEIPEVRGIYAAFVCEKTRRGLVVFSLVYIGKADKENNVRNRIKSHIDGRNEAPSGKHSNWEEWYCEDNEEICYAYAEYEEHLSAIESALIFRNQPLANDHHKDKYNGEVSPLLIICKGRKGTLAEIVKIP